MSLPKLKKYQFLWPYIFFFLITAFYFWRVFLGQIPVPLDLLVGAYLPWHDYKWGYSVGVPIKNPSISDVISSIYPWKDLGIDLIKQGQWPLWNPYSFAGTPLLGNLQSAVFYPLNIFMLFFPMHIGWTILLFLQILLAQIFMYWLLKEYGCSNLGSLAGAICFAFSGFMTTYLQLATIGQTMIWLPLLLLITERYLSKNSKLIYFFPIIIFCSITAGNLQIFFYLFLTWSVITTQRFLHYKNFRKKIFKLIILIILSFGLTSIQILPSLELFLNSIRQIDENIQNYHFGLLPIKNIITFLAPDFFGNPVTNNFWGSIGYQESTGYFGITFFILAIYSFINSIRKKEKFRMTLGILLILSLLLIYDSILGKVIYIFKVPIFSTSYATRLFTIVDFCGAILAGIGFDELLKNKKHFLKICFSFLFCLLAGEGILKFKLINFSQISIAANNLILPIILLFSICIITVFIKSKKIFATLFIILCLFDLLHFSMKFNTFAPANLLYPATPITNFLKSNIHDYRFDRVDSDVIPPNTWMEYGLSNPGGYDPLYYLDYGKFYNLYNNNFSINYGVSRYDQLTNPNSPFIDLLGVKYLVVKNESLKNIKDLRYKKIFNDKSINVLENRNVFPRISFFSNYTVETSAYQAFGDLSRGFDFRNKVILNFPIAGHLGSSKNVHGKIISYQSNKVLIEADAKDPVILMLTDSYQPGWKAKIDNKLTPIIMADGIFRAVELPPGKHLVEFEYWPDAFKIGLIISAFSLVIVVFNVVIVYRKKIW